jgi:hypothetical protein
MTLVKDVDWSYTNPMTTISEGLGYAPSDTASLTEWQYAKFAAHFRNVLNNRAQQAILEGLTQEDVAHCHEAVEIIDRATQTRNIDLLVTSHQYLLSAAFPAAVEVAFHVMKPMVSGRKVCSAIKQGHISFCETVIPMFPFEYGMSTDECYAVITLGFEDISKSGAIIELLGQGITDAVEIRAKLSPQHVSGKLLRH